MATPQQMEKKRTKQIEEILTAIGELAVDVEGLKAAQGVELKAEFDETVDRTDEILTAINQALASNSNAFAEATGLSRRILEATALMAGEVLVLKADISELKDALAKSPAAARSKSKR
jgi:hypothetical protein